MVVLQYSLLLCYSMLSVYDGYLVIWGLRHLENLSMNMECPSLLVLWWFIYLVNMSLGGLKTKLLFIHTWAPRSFCFILTIWGWFCFSIFCSLYLWSKSIYGGYLMPWGLWHLENFDYEESKKIHLLSSKYLNR